MSNHLVSGGGNYLKPETGMSFFQDHTKVKARAQAPHFLAKISLFPEENENEQESLFLQLFFFHLLILYLLLSSKT